MNKQDSVLSNLLIALAVVGLISTLVVPYLFQAKRGECEPPSTVQDRNALSHCLTGSNDTNV